MLFAGALVLMLLALSVLIIVHELGHFWVARLFGFQTPVFGFGLPFGPYWVLGNMGGTELRFHALILGGYVAIPELGDESNMSEDAYGVPLKPFRHFPIWQRALVAFAGPGFNILFAWLVMFIVLMTMGEQSQRVVVSELPASNPIAAKAGVQVQDEIISIDKTRIDSTDDIIFYLGSRPETPVTLHLVRDGKPLDLTMTTNSGGKVGMALDTDGPAVYRPLDMNPLEAAGFAAHKTERVAVQMLQGIGLMLDGIFHPQPKSNVPGQHQFGVKDLHGVLAVVKIGADIASQDWSQLPRFVIMISLDLAIINLVPWPGLDGSHLAFMLWEAVRGKPMEERKRGTIVQWGFISLLVLMAVIMYNDIEALVTGKLEMKMRKDKHHTEKKPATTGTEGQTPPGTAAPTDNVTPAPTSGTTAPTGGTTAPTGGTTAPTGGTTATPPPEKTATPVGH